jgi:hypothetical protein
MGAAVYVLGFAALLTACRGAPPAQRQDEVLARLVDSLRPPVERAAGLTFRTIPKSATRSREQVRSYLVAMMRRQLPAYKLHALETSYALFGLLPDTLDLEGLLLNVLSEQVVGFYDPDSTTLFGVRGGDRGQLAIVVAHELVHALQDDYLPLDSILAEKDDNDRSTAAQAILEGQATFVSLKTLAPGQDMGGVMEVLRETMRQQQGSMPEFANAPLLLREGLVFPYVDGAGFMLWWERSGFADTMPYGTRMPQSTEQILYPDRYARGDAPVPVRFTDRAEGVLAEDDLGELEIHILATQLAGRDEVSEGLPLGWGGDRYRVYQTPAGPALVWYLVFDDARSADRFLAGTGRLLAAQTRPRYHGEVTGLTIDGRPGMRYVFAPGSWTGWGKLPAARVETAGNGKGEMGKGK